MQSLADLGLTKTVANLQHIPDKKIPVDECEKLSTFSIVLTVAAAELIEVFRLHQRIDFSEITISARNALSRDEIPTDFALKLDYQTFHILVDEFQDTSLEQYKLLTKLVQSWYKTPQKDTIKMTSEAPIKTHLTWWTLARDEHI